jgi:penicillin-binding protein 2
MDVKTEKFIIRFLLLSSFLILFIRLFELQVIKGKYYQDLANGNRIRRIALKAPRGEIFARGGELLVRNEKKVNAIYYNDLRGYYVAGDVNEKNEKIVNVEGWQRSYPLKASASHITGYTGVVNEKESGKIASDCVDKGERMPTDLVGRSGLEEYYDCLLRGMDGEKLIEVSADGRYVRLLGEKEPVKGDDLETTIDYPLQEYVSTLLFGVKGVIIVSDYDGELLALYSSPSFDPNIFQDDPEKVSTLLNGKDLPLFNRAISGKYSPGSVFKTIIATAALETKAIDENYHYQDTGSINFHTPYGDYSYSNWYFSQYGATEGSIEVTRAIARSTDTFFYKIGELTGIDEVVNWSRKFGLAEKSGIDLPGEIEGLVPDPIWKEKVKGERWFLGNTYHLSIGQGDLSVTPIGMHTAISAISNNGNLCVPHLVSVSVDNKNFQCKDLEIEKTNIELVKEGMRKACTSGGTGYTFFDFKGKTGIDVACKTGTAQIGSAEKTHAWFTAFAPVEKPEIVVTVLVEEGGEGSKVAGPIARQIFDFWFKK